jgi:hypothetical protein
METVLPKDSWEIRDRAGAEMSPDSLSNALRTCELGRVVTVGRVCFLWGCQILVVGGA